MKSNFYRNLSHSIQTKFKGKIGKGTVDTQRHTHGHEKEKEIQSTDDIYKHALNEEIEIVLIQEGEGTCKKFQGRRHHHRRRSRCCSHCHCFSMESS